MFAIIIACGIFMLVWNSRRYFDNQFLFFIGIAYLFIGALDLTHTFVYKGMNILSGYNANAPTQLWIAARYLESITLLLSPLMLNRRIRAGLIVWGYAGVTALLLLSILYWRNFPDCFIESAGGLTPFKIVSEYFISLILVAGAVLVFRLRNHLSPDVLLWLLASYALKLFSELAFSNYASVYGSANMLGHMFKIASFYCVYKAVIVTGLTKPYDAMFNNLSQSRERYRSLFVHMIDGYASHTNHSGHEGRPVDYRFLEVNDAFQRLTGLGNVAGKRATEVIPGIENDPAQWIKVYGEVATTGRSIRFENFAATLGPLVLGHRLQPGQG